jgi:hypothetical protein
MKNMVVLVKENGDEGKVIAVFEEFWQALQVAQTLDSPYRIYVKSFEHIPEEETE